MMKKHMDSAMDGYSENDDESNNSRYLVGQEITQEEEEAALRNTDSKESSSDNDILKDKNMDRERDTKNCGERNTDLKLNLKSYFTDNSNKQDYKLSLPPRIQQFEDEEEQIFMEEYEKYNKSPFQNKKMIKMITLSSPRMGRG